MIVEPMSAGSDYSICRLRNSLPHPTPTLSKAPARLATVRSTLCHFSNPNNPTRKVLKSGPSSHCNGTPAAVCKPSFKNFLPG